MNAFESVDPTLLALNAVVLIPVFFLGLAAGFAIIRLFASMLDQSRV